jgi:hypothetical protein
MREFDFLPVDFTLANELEDIDQLMGPTLGPTNDKSISDARFRASIADSPIALPMSKLMALSDQPTSNLPVAIYDMFELWLVPHRFSVHAVEGSGAGLVSVGCEIDYDLGDGPSVSIVSLFPASQSALSTSVEVSGRINAQAILSPLGFISTPDPKTVAEHRPATTELSAAVRTASMHLEAGWKDGPVLTIKHEIPSPILSVSGVGSQKCQFLFERYKEPLHARDIETFAVVATKRRRKHMSYKMKVVYGYKRIFFPVRHETEWVTINVALQN